MEGVLKIKDPFNHSIEKKIELRGNENFLFSEVEFSEKELTPFDGDAIYELVVDGQVINTGKVYIK